MRKSSTVGTSIYSANLHGEFNEEKNKHKFLIIMQDTTC